MELNDLLAVMDRAAANLAKLEELWGRAAPFIPTSPARGTHQEYEDLCRAWNDLLVGLPKVDGWTITEGLPDIDALGQEFIDYMDIGEAPFSALKAGDKPAADLAQYRYRLHRARRRAARRRLEELISAVDSALLRVVQTVDRASQDKLAGADVKLVVNAVAEIERLMGDSAQRRGRWGDLHRHMHFGEGHDWHDIHEFDWPSVRPDIEAAAFSDTEPLPVPDIDLGEAASGNPTGPVTVALPWERLNDDGFERLLFNLLEEIPEYQNVQWLMNTRAPDRGRDLSCELVIRDSTGSVRTERVIVQAKHWQSKAVALQEINNNVAQTMLWPPPVVRVLIVATSGRFTTDAVAWVEQHNDKAEVPRIELWSNTRLESLLAQKPHIAAAHGLR